MAIRGGEPRPTATRRRHGEARIRPEASPVFFSRLVRDGTFPGPGVPNVPQILETIVAMAHHMQMKVTTEGIETQAQVDLMKRLGCDQLQGYLFGKPMPADRVAAEILTRFRIGENDSRRPARGAMTAG